MKPRTLTIDELLALRQGPMGKDISQEEELHKTISIVIDAYYDAMCEQHGGDNAKVFNTMKNKVLKRLLTTKYL